MRVYQFRHVGTGVAVLLLFSIACSATEARIIRERVPLVKREVLLFKKISRLLLHPHFRKLIRTSKKPEVGDEDAERLVR